MTATVKLPEQLEQRLRQQCAVSGRSLSDVMRDALEMYLKQAEMKQRASPLELGLSLFGRHAGSADLSESFRRARDDVWAEIAADKSASQRPRPRA